MDYKGVLLNRLLDKYERSKSYLGADSSRRVLLKLCSEEFPEYDIEKPELKELINSIVEKLASNDLVGYQWLKYEKGNIIEKVWLKLDKVEMVYKEAGRLPKSGRVLAILEMVKELKEHISIPWITRYLEDTESNIDAKKSVTPFLPDDEKEAQAVLGAIKAIHDQNNEECLERVFSVRCFGDSKFFERSVKKRVIDIIRNYLLKSYDLIESPSDDEILAQVGIVKAPEQVEFCGGMLGVLAGKSIDFSVFTQGIAVNSHTVKAIEISELKSVQRVLFIENKTNYVDYVAKKKTEKELVIYHGGFYSPVKGLFFKKIYEAGLKTGVSFYHWSDIDIGGFRIFSRLKTNIILGLKPLFMDKAAFLSKRQYWIPFHEKYYSALEGMLRKDEFAEFHEVIKTMLEVRSRLEQEAFL
jgi:hypothetical protein